MASMKVCRIKERLHWFIRDTTINGPLLFKVICYIYKKNYKCSGSLWLVKNLNKLILRYTNINIDSKSSYKCLNPQQNMYNWPFTRAFNKKGHHHTCKTLELSGNRKKWWEITKYEPFIYYTGWVAGEGEAGQLI